MGLKFWPTGWNQDVLDENFSGASPQIMAEIQAYQNQEKMYPELSLAAKAVLDQIEDPGLQHNSQGLREDAQNAAKIIKDLARDTKDKFVGAVEDQDAQGGLAGRAAASAEEHGLPTEKSENLFDIGRSVGAVGRDAGDFLTEAGGNIWETVKDQFDPEKMRARQRELEAQWEAEQKQRGRPQSFDEFVRGVTGQESIANGPFTGDASDYYGGEYDINPMLPDGLQSIIDANAPDLPPELGGVSIGLPDPEVMDSVGQDAATGWEFDPENDMAPVKPNPSNEPATTTSTSGGGSTSGGQQGLPTPQPPEEDTGDEDLNALQRFVSNRFGLDQGQRHDLAKSLIKGGFATMAGESPFAMVNIGKGGMVGSDTYQGLRDDRMDRDTEKEDTAWQRAKDQHAMNRLDRADSRAAEKHGWDKVKHGYDIKKLEQEIANAGKSNPLKHLTDKQRGIYEAQSLYEAGLINEATYNALIGKDDLE